MKKTLALAALALAAATPLAQAQDSGNWIVRGRAMYLDPANKDSTGLGLSINSKTFPEVDITYFFSPNLATELILTYPQKQTVHSSVLAADIGTLKHLPPTLMLQYHFTGNPSFRPYVGAGLNLTLFSKVDLAGGAASIESSSTGLAIGAGFDVPLGGGWLFNVDVKKVQIRTDVGLDTSGTVDRGESPKGLNPAHTNMGSFKVDPLLFSIGFGKRF
jgi:outer membrane protein